MDMTQFATAQQAAFESSFGTAGQAFESIEKLAALNLQTIKTTLAESAELSQALLSSTTPDAVLQLTAAAFQAVPPKSLAYGRQVIEIVTTATALQRAAAESKVSEVQAQFVEAISATLKNAPGAENTLALVQSAVDAANKARDNFTNTTQQVTDAMSANVATLADTTVKATPRIANTKRAA